MSWSKSPRQDAALGLTSGFRAHSEFEVVIDNMSAFYRSNAEITHYANDAESMRQM